MVANGVKTCRGRVDRLAGWLARGVRKGCVQRLCSGGRERTGDACAAPEGDAPLPFVPGKARVTGKEKTERHPDCQLFLVAVSISGISSARRRARHYKDTTRINWESLRKVCDLLILSKGLGTSRQPGRGAAPGPASAGTGPLRTHTHTHTRPGRRRDCTLLHLCRTFIVSFVVL